MRTVFLFTPNVALTFERLGQLIARRWMLIIPLWIILAVCAVLSPPHWDDVTLDGDLAYLPATSPMLIAEREITAAFPDRKAKSQIVIIASRRDEEPLTDDEWKTIDRLASPFQNAQGIEWLRQAEAAEGASQEALFKRAEATLTEAELLDYDAAEPVWNLAALAKAEDRGEIEVERLKAQAIALDPSLEQATSPTLPADAPDWKLFDVWTRHTPVVGKMLVDPDKRAGLIILHLTNELAATDNIRIVSQIETLVDKWREEIHDSGDDQLQIGITGSAAIGGDMLLAAKESIASTEFYTIALVIVILLVVYRAPLLAMAPLLAIAISFCVATWLVASLTLVDQIPGFGWWNFEVFKTSKIFVVVILFGAGTDFCLFLISRYKEELADCGDPGEAVAKALGGTASAICGSALTTIVGLGMMFFAEFGKFRNSGPAIALCLLVTLAVCLTFAPALLRMLGRKTFWPMSVDSLTQRTNDGRGNFWELIAALVSKRPALLLALTVSLLLVPAWRPIWLRVTTGYAVDVSYDLLNDLPSDRPAKQGANQLAKYFPLGQANPVAVMVRTNAGDFESKEGGAAIAQLTKVLFNADPHVARVYSSENPLGHRPGRISLLTSEVFLKNHIRTREQFLPQTPEMKGKAALFRVVVDENPFSLDAIAAVQHIEEALEAYRANASGNLTDLQIYVSGATAGVRDLRSVTKSDTQRIEVLVVLGVAAVLLIILRRPVVCAYMIASVLLSYYATLGMTEWFFAAMFPDSYQGLDWKAPLFLFVILIAVGQDYNIYLATRVFEEQRKHGAIAGMRVAIRHTGGIISSCGVIMAGTFVAMCFGQLLAIVEIGFSLTVGILVDTFIVRTVMMPCFLTLWTRRSDPPPS
ncbi:MMPL family transporter [Blastopirellula retiformator]|uniref:Putative membrane protein YdgH n=1 Tax=Blastopirellula retiformator TaxID=2527970 RepID=A0A5C5VL13_9BACT|nr:MMPL family transporter [Blastopirellula retiformator]TWT38677.1 putative membrane protein YdgH [Blastopirellula retiformator]